MSWILTASGKHFNYLDPRGEDIDIIDIAQALANEPRFGGHTRVFYPVAQHSWLASHIVPAPFALEALLHDGEEAYCKDIPQPLKLLLPDYREIASRVGGAVRARYGLPQQMSSEVHHADLVMLATERRDLMPPDPTPWAILDGIEPLPKRIIAMSPVKAQAVFLKRYIQLTENRRAA